MNNAEEATKIARETKFAVLGRAIADSAANGQDPQRLIDQARILRAIEQRNADRQTLFAGLARQIGDAAGVGRDTEPLVERLRELRRRERGPSGIRHEAAPGHAAEEGDSLQHPPDSGQPKL